MQRKSIMFSRIVLFLLLLSLPAGLSAQVQEYQAYKDYTVERGDTLWDITKEELQDPFLWPKVWNENPDIDNPDKIYPNQKIKIPLHLLQKEMAPPAPKPMVKPSVKPKPEEQPVIITTFSKRVPGR